MYSFIYRFIYKLYVNVNIHCVICKLKFSEKNILGSTSVGGLRFSFKSNVFGLASTSTYSIKNKARKLILNILQLFTMLFLFQLLCFFFCSTIFIYFNGVMKKKQTF